MWICRGKELQPFPSLYSPFLHFFICQPSIDSLPSPSLTTLPSSYLPLLLPFPVPFVVPLSLSTFLLPFQPSLSLPTFPFPTFPLPYQSPSLLISFPAYPLLYLSLPSPPPTFPPSPSFSLFRSYPFLYFFLPLFLSFSPSLFSNSLISPFFPLFLSPILFPVPSLFLLFSSGSLIYFPASGGRENFIQP